MGAITGLLTTLVGKLSYQVGSAARVTIAAGDTLWTSLERFLIRISTGAIGLLWGVLVVASIAGAGLVLNLVGVDDVYSTLDGFLGDDEAERPAVPDPTDVDPEAVTDSQGHFSADRLRRVTGLGPTEFIHLVVQGNGGRIEQAALCTLLPWSRSTVSRYLDDLEEAGVVERVSTGNRNVVCTPDEVPASKA